MESTAVEWFQTAQVPARITFGDRPIDGNIAVIVGPRGAIPSGYGVSTIGAQRAPHSGCPVERSPEAIQSWLAVHLFKHRIVQ